MSWQSYIDDQLIGSGNIDKAVIIGLDGKSIGASRGFNIPQSEGVAIVDLFNNPVSVFSKGIVVGGVKYNGIKGDSRSIYGKKGAVGVVTAKSNTAIVIGVYNENQLGNDAAQTVERLVDYLLDNDL